MMTREMAVELPNGLEARPVAELVQVASRHTSDIHIEVEDKRVNAKSIMGMMSLSLVNGQQIRVTAEGTDEADSLNDIEAYLKGEIKL